MYKLPSLHLSKLLDLLGYSPQMIRYRRETYQERDKMATRYMGGKSVTAGSKGEGLTKYYESDHDTLYFIDNAMCFDEDMELHFDMIPRQITPFTMQKGSAVPGYTELYTEHLGNPIHELLFESLLQTGPSRCHLSSDEFSQQVKKVLKHKYGHNSTESSSGAAFRESYGLLENDSVCTLPCKVPTILAEWLVRERPHDWPPVELRERISQMDGNVVAAGFNRSFSKFLEWRICFNEIEQLLTHSLNATQLKLYVILKMITKDILQPDQKEITSYTMKNIVWWLAESYPSDRFKELKLINWILKALRLLQRSLKMNCLPYYMLPERNLLCENMTEYLRKRHIHTLENMLKRPRPFFLLGCKQLNRVKYMSFESLNRFSEQRDELETLTLANTNYGVRLQCQGLSKKERAKDETNRAMHARMRELVYSPWPQHLQQKLDQAATVKDKLELILH